jgi:hypothetical protein
MTDEQIAEIYSLGRESFFGGQKSFQFQAYPFRMTPINMAKHRNNPNMAFWKMIKEGYDHFEVTRQEPKVDFCEKKYVFDAAKPPGATRDPAFDAAAKCPAYVIPDEIASAVRQKQDDDQAETAKLIAKGTPVAKLNTGIDGGMNQIFAARVPGGNTGLSEGGDGQSLALSSFSRAPGTIPSTVNPPRVPGSDNAAVAAAATPAPDAAPSASAPAPTTRVASAAPNAQSDGLFSSLARKMGFGGGDTTASTQSPAPAKPKAADAKPAAPKIAVPAKPADAAKLVDTAKPADTKQAASRPPFKPTASEAPPADPTPAPKSGLVAGAQPIVQSNSFDSRFSATK